MPIELLHGAFVAELVKGKNGKESWKYTPRLDRIGKKPPKKESLKEKPQYPIIEEWEGSSKKRYKRTLKAGTLEIISFLKKL